MAERESSVATPASGPANPIDLVDLLGNFREVRGQADRVILLVHGGLELRHDPSPGSVKGLQFLAAQIVTAVIRHHAHFVQGHEMWQGVPLFYGPGNLLFDVAVSGRPGRYWGLVRTLEIAADNTCSLRLQPVSDCEQEPVVAPLKGEHQVRALYELALFSEILRDPDALALVWDRALEQGRDFYLGWLVLRSLCLSRGFGRLGLRQFARLSLLTARVWKCLFVCEAHWQAVVEMLSGESRR